MTTAELIRLLSGIRQSHEKERVLIYSNYPKELPSVIIEFGNFADHYHHFFDLMEESVVVLSEEMADYLEIDSEGIAVNNETKIKVIGERFRSVLSEVKVT